MPGLVRADVKPTDVAGDVETQLFPDRQAFPYFDWQFAKHASLQAGYRFLYTDYETGSGLNRFKYDILTQGPQFGFTLHF